MKLGFVVNPMAGIGGPVALKGSDGRDIVEQALARGGCPQAQRRASAAMEKLQATKALQCLTASGGMGEDILQALDIAVQVVYQSNPSSTSEDTKQAIRCFVENKVDLIVFAGGDGTARDVLDVLSKEKQSSIPVIGIPAGVKIHSAVYAVTPVHAGELIKLIADGQAMSLIDAQVMDLDEAAFREGRVIAKCYGYLSVPVDDTRMQLMKQGGIDDEQVLLEDIAADIIECMQAGVYYLIGSGSTTAELMNQLGLKNTLLGVDIIRDDKLIASDVDEQTILRIISGHKASMIITIIGGQGHIFGRGNQQLSASVIREVLGESIDKDNLLLVATNNKLHSLNNRPMVADTGDTQLDKTLSGLYTVITGYQQRTLYRLNA